MSPRTPILLSLLLATGLSAQGAPLLVKTADSDIAEKLTRAESVDLPTLDDGEHWVLTIDDDGKMAATKASGKVETMHLSANPGRLLDIFDEKVQQAQQMARMFSGMAASQAGLQPRDLNQLIDQAFDFPRQLGTVTIDVTGSPEQNMGIKVRLSPVADGWLAKLVADLKTGGGAPQLLGSGESLMAMSLDVDSAIFGRLVEPFVGLVTGAASGGDADAGKQMTEMMNTMMGYLGGPMAMAIQGDGSTISVGVLKDTDGMKELMASERYAQWSRGIAEMNPMADVEVEMNAGTHRDVRLMKTVIDTGQPSPMSEDGIVESYNGICGAYSLATQGGGERAIKKLIDSALDNKITRAALPGSALMTLTMKFRDFADKMSNGMASAGDDAPEHIAASLSKSGSDLELSVKLTF